MSLYFHEKLFICAFAPELAVNNQQLLSLKVITIKNKKLRKIRTLKASWQIFCHKSNRFFSFLKLIRMSMKTRDKEKVRDSAFLVNSWDSNLSQLKSI